MAMMAISDDSTDYAVESYQAAYVITNKVRSEL